jgi:heptosyltransferase I
MTRSLPSEPKSICIVMLSALGDAVHVMPVITALKRRWPDARITWIVQPLTWKLVRVHPDVNEFVLFRRRSGVSALRSYRELRQSLRGRRFDLLLALQVYFKAGVITALVNADAKLGFDRRRARDLNWLVTTHRIPAAPYAHAQEQYFEFLTHLGIDPHPLDWKLGPTEEERVEQSAYFAELRRPVCSVVVATSDPRKNWQPARYARVIDALEHEFGYTVQIVGGPAASERAIAESIVRASHAAPRIALHEDLRRLVWLLDGSDLVISPDTGPLHMARAVDVPVIGLYGFTNPKRGGPYGRFSDLVADGYALHEGEEYSADPVRRPGGMERISVEMVLDRVRLARERYGVLRQRGED